MHHYAHYAPQFGSILTLFFLISMFNLKVYENKKLWGKI